ncbi:MAG: hypothetical protein BIFFINMI_03116 [Phycisphaerae bacterium]|nr:hypothetical protein [Phycisphaerae bacterium]
MKIGVLSDTHDRMPTLDAAVRLFEAEKADAVIHAGDFVAPFAARRLMKFAGPVHTVFGNNDGERAGLGQVMPGCQPGPMLLELGGRRILVHHWIDQVPAKMIARAEVVITGHTHEVVNEVRDGRLILNPGECCGWLTGRATVAILDTDRLAARIVTLDEGPSWRP